MSHATDKEAATEPLALRAREAAAALGLSERTLWSLTNRGLVPHLRVGRAVLYPVAELRQWLVDQIKSPKGGAE